MGALYFICIIFSMHMTETFGQLSLLQNRTVGENGLLPSTVSGKASNFLRDILNQESLVRFSMVQRIQTLVMDAIDNKNDRQVIKTKLGDVIKELQDLETKDQRIETENAELKREMKALNVTLNNTKFISMEEIRNLNETEIHALRTHFASDLQDLVKKEEHISAKIISLNETEISNLKRQTLALQKENLNLIKESRTTKSQLEAIERKLDALNSSYSVSEIEIQKKIKVNLQNNNILRDDLQMLKKVYDDIRSESVVLKNNTLEVTETSESLKDQLNQMNETLHKISASNIFDQLASAENMFRIFSASVNKSFENFREDLNESSLQMAEISNQLTLFRAGYSYCADILRKLPSLRGRDGVYPLKIASKTKFVYCDMTTEGGGWTAIQRRQDGSTDFYRTWSEYKQGFGDPSKNYWIGNDAMYELTKNKDQELRVWLQRFNGDEAYAEYSTFYVGNEDSKYKLTVLGYSGTAGDSLAFHNGSKFSTKDQENDNWSDGKCAVRFHGAWWYHSSCHHSHLNGEYAQSALSNWKYPVWSHWKNTEALQKTAMFIRHS